MNCFPINGVRKIIFPIFLVAFFQNLQAQKESRIIIGTYSSHNKVVAAKTGNGWGLMVEGSGLNAVAQPAPIQFEFYEDPAHIDKNGYGYQSVVKKSNAVGLQLISSGHSLVDMYMAFDVDEYAGLFKYTGDVHYLAMARLLLHNTKSMLALPERMYDLKGPGWQQEHWSLAPHRGFGLHRGWLPWVSTSHLNGIFGLEELDKTLYNQLIKPGAEKRN